MLLILGSLSQRPWWVGLIVIGIAVVFFLLILAASVLIRTPSARPGKGKSLTDREFDAHQQFEGRLIMRTGDMIDFEADQKPPRY